MEPREPMDRLSAVTVGYGKTESRACAAFKVNDNITGRGSCAHHRAHFKHFETLRKGSSHSQRRHRNAQPFAASAEQKQNPRDSGKRAKSMSFIGTHRRLSKDVKFADLGLLVVA